MQINSDILKINKSKPFHETKNSRNMGTFITFLIWPFLGVLLSFKNYKYYSSRNAIWLFIIFIGLTFKWSYSDDTQRYVDELVFYRNQNWNLFEFFNHIVFDKNEGRIDFIQPLINFVITKFTSDPQILLASYGLVFGFFYSRNIWFLIDQVEYKIKTEALAYLLLFCFLVMPQYGINGVRYWTGVHMLMFGLINYLSLNNKIRGYVFVFGSIFMHDAHIVSIFLVLSYFLIGKNKKSLDLFFYLYLTSFVLSNVSPEFVKLIISDLPIKLKDREGYLSEEYIESVADNANTLNWYILYQYTMMKVLVATSVIWLYYYRKSIITDNLIIRNYYSVGIIFITFTNYVGHLPSMGRYSYLGFLSLAMALFLIFQNTPFKRRPDWYKISSLGIIIILCVTKIWQAMVNSGIDTLLANPLSLWFFNTTETLMDLVKKIS